MSDPTDDLEIETDGEQETEAVGALLGAMLQGGAVVALVGALGGGKTCFVRGVARGMGHGDAAVTSPTFVICQEHQTPGVRPLVHIDAYRIGAADLDSIGWEELLATPDLVIAVEWADRVADRLPPGTVMVSFEHAGPTHRILRVRAASEFVSRLRMVVALPCPICGRPARIESAPFCSPRCRTVDLGRWMSGQYAIGRPLVADSDDGETPPEDAEQGG